jgi:hypothetical protein
VGELISNATEARCASKHWQAVLANEADVSSFLQAITESSARGSYEVTIKRKKMSLGQRAKLTRLGFEVTANVNGITDTHYIAWATPQPLLREVVCLDG